ncbi:GspMb/PilO family protein [Phycisphaerales bacterium AB-hyl4]|uniref:GspMb/PilO family protein n=1 Tax=Natronomicrosphaera hydrolytica TaxID=3242702 RepID=A0ABV4TZG4_9BACT
MSRREKLIAIVTLTLVALFVGDRLVVEPALAYRERLQQSAERERDAREAGERLYDGLTSLEQRWSALQASGLADSAADAEARLSQAVSGWASDTGVSLTSLSADRVETGDRLPRVHMRVVATGSMGEMVGMLGQLASAELPVRVQELQLASRGDGEQLTMNLRVSTLYTSDQPQSGPVRAGRAGR